MKVRREGGGEEGEVEVMRGSGGGGVECEGDDAPALAKLIWRIFLQSGTPASLVSDRDSVFTSEYWSTLCYHLRIQLA
jgi:hypothetical protein